MYASWDIECDRQSFVIWVIFCSLPHYWLKKLKFWDIEKMPGRIISLNLCITIDNHMMYVSQDAEHDRHNFLSFWTAIYLLTTRKIKILKKWEDSSGDVIILQMCIKNHDHMMYASWDIECDRQSFVILGHVLPFTPLLTRKLKNLRDWKNCLDALLVYTCVSQLTIIWYMVHETQSITDIVFCHFELLFTS